MFNIHFIILYDQFLNMFTNIIDFLVFLNYLTYSIINYAKRNPSTVYDIKNNPLITSCWLILSMFGDLVNISFIIMMFIIITQEIMIIYYALIIINLVIFMSNCINVNEYLKNE